MRRHERLNVVLESLAERGTLSVDEIAARFDVSAATARRDLDDLATQQLVTRTRGGAIAQSVTYDLPLRYKSVRQTEEKQRIGAAAAALVTPGAVVGFNGGTTTTVVARALATRADLNVDSSVGRPAFTVVTNALNIANELTVRSHIKIVVLGGVARPQSYELIGPIASRALEDLTMDLLILGVNAISPTDGAAAKHEGEAQINHEMVTRARRVVVVADGSKLGRHAFCRICGLSSVDLLLTDTGADPSVVAQFRDAGVKVQTV